MANHTVYCEICGAAIHGIKNVDRFLGWHLLNHSKVTCRRCRHGERTHDPRTGNVLTWRGIDGVDYAVNTPANQIPLSALIRIGGNDE